MKKIIILLSLLMISGCSKSIVLDQVSQYEDNILSYGILPGNNFFVDEIKPDQLQLEWDASAHGSFASTSFITNDTLVFVSDLGGRITSFSLNDGKEIGQLKYSGGIEQTAVIDKNRLFFIVNEEKEVYSTLIVYDLLKGNEIASQRLNGRFATELVKKNNSVFAVSSFGLLYSFSPFGAVNWKIDLDTEVYANSAADEDHLFIATYSGIIHKIKINGGVILNSFDLGTEFDSGISLDDQNIYIGDKKGSLIAIDKMKGSVVWKYKSNYGIKATPSYDESNIYFGNLGGEIISLSKINGSLNWVMDTEGLINTSPLVFRNIILQSNQFKKLDLVDKETGEIINTINYNSRCRTTPIYFKERVIVGIDKSEVLCYSFVEEK